MKLSLFACISLIACNGQDVTQLINEPPIIDGGTIIVDSSVGIVLVDSKIPVDDAGTCLDAGIDDAALHFFIDDASVVEIVPPIDAGHDAGSVKIVPTMSFSIVGPDPYGYLTAQLPIVLQRWSVATCTNLVVGEGEHVVQYGDRTNMTGTRLGQTTGTWDNAIIRIKSELIQSTVRVVMMHEIGHVLGRTNEHSTDGIDSYSMSIPKITASSLELACKSWTCKCQHPEI